MTIVASVPAWPTIVAAGIALVGSLVTLAATGWIETLRLRSQHRSEERRKLKALIGAYHGRLLEAAVDWDRRMEQMYSSRVELEATRGASDRISVRESYLEDKEYFNHPDPVLRTYGKFCSRDEYFFRSFVYRLVALCAIARRFELEAFFIDSQVARPADFGFLKYAKSFLWVMSTTELPYGMDFPNYDHIPSDHLRPVLDSCYRTSEETSADSNGSREPRCAAVFDLERLDLLVERERRAESEVRWREEARRALDRAIAPQTGHDESERTEETPSTARQGYVAAGFGRLLMMVNGLRKPTDEGSRLAWDRFCVLHLLVLAFIHEFGYRWQRPKTEDLRQAVENITHSKTLIGFHDAISDPLALARHDGRFQVRFVSRRHPAKKLRKLLREASSSSRDQVVVDRSGTWEPVQTLAGEGLTES
jgi:hypothetical protein